jgi:hypothetical protein
MLKLHLASTILALKHSWLVLQHKERRHWTNNFMVYSSNLLLNRCFPCFMVYVLHTWYCFCLKNSLLFLLIKKIKFGDSWVITFLILSGCYFNVFSFLVEMSLINRLFSCFQTQAEGLLGEIHVKEMELERLNGQWRQLQSNNSEANNARNRFVRGSSDKVHSLSDYDGPQRLPYHSAGRTESQQRLMLLRSAFVLYILALNVIVFIRISFWQNLRLHITFYYLTELFFLFIRTYDWPLFVLIEYLVYI